MPFSTEQTAFSNQQTEILAGRGFNRRQIARMATLLTAGATLPFYNEYAMAQDAERQDMRRMGAGMAQRRAMDPDTVRISSNENPMGPCKEGLEALIKVAPKGWRYSPGNEQGEFTQAVSEQLGVKPNYIQTTAGSSDPLNRTMCAFTSPTRGWCLASPGYASRTPEFIGSKVVTVPLKDDYSHDVVGMIKRAPDAGAYYVCNPNNPTGTLTTIKDIEYLLANKQKDAVVVVDEAYIHFSADAESAIGLVAQDKDVVVLRTFSKIYGMAGLRAGMAIGRPDLLDKMRNYSSGGFLPVTALACATASMKVKSLIADRRAQMKQVRENTFAYLEKKGISFIPSQTNFFMMEVKRPGTEFARALAEQKVVIGTGNRWPVWPTKVRVTVGTQEEMNKFTAAVDKVWG